ncbi:hypothetical protein PMI34_03486, partial [Pseudomonas sp. GM74]
FEDEVLAIAVFLKNRIVRFYDGCAAERSLAGSAAATSAFPWKPFAGKPAMRAAGAA